MNTTRIPLVGDRVLLLVPALVCIDTTDEPEGDLIEREIPAGDGVWTIERIDYWPPRQGLALSLTHERGGVVVIDQTDAMKFTGNPAAYPVSFI